MKIERKENSQELAELLFKGISEEALKAKGLAPIANFNLLIEDEKGDIFGGASGAILYGCLYVDMLWIDPSLRHLSWGSRLMKEAEKLGIESGCTFAAVNTMDWEALLFYQKLGYEIEFVREGFEKDSKMYLLRKSL